VPENVDKTSWCECLVQNEHLDVDGICSSSFAFLTRHGELSCMKKL
jgi:hypothetical protein